jgi:superfamily II DNA helicase RecQ
MTYGLQDVVQLRRMIDESEAGEAHKRVMAGKLDAMLGLCETSDCRRVRLLHYFGEPSTACGNCDTCLDPPVSFDGTVAVQQLLSCIYRTGQRFGAMHVIDVLRGERNDKVTQWDHDKLSTYGIGGDRSGQEWRAVIRQCIALGLLVVDHDGYSALKLTAACRPVLKGEQSVTLRQWRKAEKTKRVKRPGGIAADLPASAQGVVRSPSRLARRCGAPPWRACICRVPRCHTEGNRRFETGIDEGAARHRRHRRKETCRLRRRDHPAGRGVRAITAESAARWIAPSSPRVVTLLRLCRRTTTTHITVFRVQTATRTRPTIPAHHGVRNGNLYQASLRQHSAGNCCAERRVELVPVAARHA